MQLHDLIQHDVLLFDGAMGTGIQQAAPGIEDFEGHEGLNEWLCLTRPELIADLHRAYFDAGCRIVETNSFGAFPVVLDEFGVGHMAEELAASAAAISRRVADEKSGRFVAGSMGPGTRLPSLGHIPYQELKASYKPLARGLIRGGADLLLIETCQDPLQVRAAARACAEVQEELGSRLPIAIQVTVESSGTMLLGTEVQAALAALAGQRPAFFGLNCATGPDAMLPHLQVLARRSPFPISVQPNAGLPRTEGGRMIYDLEPEEFARWQLRFIKDLGVRVLGGCCGTRPEHLEALSRELGKSSARPGKRSPQLEDAVSGLYHATPLEQKPGPLLIGERTNANGSRAFRKALEEENWDELIEIARSQEGEGAHVLDVCVAAVSRDEKADMQAYLQRLRSECTLPLMIDSTDPATVRIALELLGGRAIVNSINLEDGEARARELLELCHEHGAAVVALCIDEEGMALTVERKLTVAHRLVNLAAEYELAPSDMLIDPLTFTLGSGDTQYRHSACHTLEAIERIKQELPGARTLLGLSNVSFGLKPALRRVLNSVFLDKALQHGLDAAILHAGRILHPSEIDPELRQLCERLISGNHDEGDPLAALLRRGMPKGPSDEALQREAEMLPVGERLRQRIIKGRTPGIESDLAEALSECGPFEIINQHLLEGMREVGDLFGAGKLQLPFVLKSAETMKRAVGVLEPEIKKASSGEWQNRGRLLLATVRGDVHDIGKNLVAILLRNNGYEVVDLGIKVPVEKLIEGIREHKPHALGLSGLLVKSTLVMRENLEVFNAEGINLPVILGGAALNRRFVEGELRELYHGDVYYARDAFEGLSLLAAIRSGEAAPVRTAAEDAPAEAPAAKQAERPRVTSSTDPLSDKAPDNSMPDQVALLRPPFWGNRVEHPLLEKIWPWLNLQTLVRGEWGFKRGRMDEAAWLKVEEETITPLLRELKQEAEEKGWLKPAVIRGWYPVKSEGRRLWIWESPDATDPKWHLDFPRQLDAPWRSISDFFRAVDEDDFDVLGVQWVTVGQEATLEAQRRLAQDAYSQYLYVHGLGVETAEALAEYTHRLMREDLGIADQDAADLHRILRQGYRGSRYSFGYPACPHLEDQRVLAEMLDVSRIGCSLSEEWQIEPEQSTSAIVVHHPEARYFSVE
jgi:5-methyltetrahydrofolate--homocysteine methyltransferase